MATEKSAKFLIKKKLTLLEYQQYISDLQLNMTLWRTRTQDWSWLVSRYREEKIGTAWFNNSDRTVQVCRSEVVKSFYGVFHAKPNFIEFLFPILPWNDEVLLLKYILQVELTSIQLNSARISIQVVNPFMASKLYRLTFTLLYFAFLYFTLLYIILLYFTLLYFTLLYWHISDIFENSNIAFE